jgi:hypothetical protein
MAGVRSYGGGTPPVVEPRGLPKDMSYTTKYKHGDWGADAHTPSWLTTIEFEAAYGEAEGFRDPEIEAILAAMKSLEKNGRESRIVFWFDN